uniref:Uncharacterized protein n=1 Tax=Trichogramma kaykai TaxID=54128 RepID=A0ABD2XIA4_9HYME
MYPVAIVPNPWRPTPTPTTTTTCSSFTQKGAKKRCVAEALKSKNSTVAILYAEGGTSPSESKKSLSFAGAHSYASRTQSHIFVTETEKGLKVKKCI